MKQTLKAGFLKGAASKADFPDSPFPEIAFVGRSNVGKSSLLNFVVRDRSMAKVSATPGKTQQINFFPVESKWMFVDVHFSVCTACSLFVNKFCNSVLNLLISLATVY